MGGGAIFGFWGQIGLKSAKNVVFTLQANIAPTGYANEPDKFS